MVDTGLPTTELGYVNPNGADGSMWAAIQAQAELVPELQWPQSVSMYRRMPREDSRVSSVLSAIGLPIRAAQARLDPNGARPEVVEFVASSLGVPIRGKTGEPIDTKGRARGRFSWKRHVVDSLSSLRYGHAYFEQVYRYDEETGLLRLHKLAPRPQHTIEKITVGLDGGLESITQKAPSGLNVVRAGQIAPAPIDVSRLVAYVRDPEPGDWLGESILRPAYKHWLLKDELIRIEAATARRNGMGLPIYFGSDHEDTIGKDLETGRAMTRSVRAGMGSGLAIPAGADFKLAGVQGNLPDIREAIGYHDKAIALAGLAHFLNLEGSGGSYALASVQSDTFVQAVQAIADMIYDTANMHVVEDLVDVNFGEDEPAPILVFDEIGSRRDAVAAALQQLVAAGILFPDRTLEESVRQSYGLPAKQVIPNVPTPADKAREAEKAAEPAPVVDPAADPADPKTGEPDTAPTSEAA